jgi:hypothetical protein
MDKLTTFWRSLSRQTVILMLDWLIIFAVLILIVVIYIPKSIWAEEEAYLTESRRRLQVMQDAEDFYSALRGHYTTEGSLLFKLVSQVHDSLIADTTFTDLQVVHIDGSPYRVTVPEMLGIQMDTTFSVGRQLKQEILDTTYTFTRWNDERAAYDTLFRNGSVSLAQAKQDSAFSEVIDTSHGSHTEAYTDYRWNRFRLEEKLLSCPVTGELYSITFDSTDATLTIASPIVNEYTERRYLLFKFRAKDHGEIVAGEASWGSR